MYTFQSLIYQGKGGIIALECNVHVHYYHKCTHDECNVHVHCYHKCTHDILSESLHVFLHCPPDVTNTVAMYRACWGCRGSSSKYLIQIDIPVAISQLEP